MIGHGHVFRNEIFVSSALYFISIFLAWRRRNIRIRKAEIFKVKENIRLKRCSCFLFISLIAAIIFCLINIGMIFCEDLKNPGVVVITTVMAGKMEGTYIGISFLSDLHKQKCRLKP